MEEMRLAADNMESSSDELEADGYEELRESQEVNNTRQDEPEEIIERAYTLRPLRDGDLWTMLQILRKINLKEYTKTFTRLATGEQTIREVGSVIISELINLFIENLPAAHDEIYAFWSDLSGIQAEDIEEMEFGTLPLMFMDTFKSAIGGSFFKVLS